MKKNLLIGNFGAKNLGDELILDAALNQFGAENSIVMTNDSESSQQFCEKSFETIHPFPTGIRSLLRFIFSHKYRQNILKKRENINRIVFVGGGLFAIRFRAYFIWWLTALWIKKLFKGVPIYWEYQGIDNPKSVIEKFLLTSALNGAAKISVRDEKSLEALESVGLNGEVKADRVFESLQTAHSSSRSRLDGKRSDLKKDILLLNVIKPMTANSWLKVQSLASHKNLKIVFVSFTPTDVKNIPENFEGTLRFPSTKKELFTLFATAKIAIGERFHFLVLGKSFCPETTLLLREPYALKVESFCQKNGIKKL